MSQMIAAARRPAMEMQQKNPMMLHDTFFSLKGVQERPVSVATEFMESDFEEDEDIMSDFYDDDDNDGENSPRASLNSGQPSFTTISSYDEVPTPRSSRVPVDAAVSRPTAEMEMSKPVEGPRGPHLFRISSLSADFANALSLSPITPKVTFYEEVFQEQREHYYQPQQPQQPQQQQQQQREYEQYEQYYHPQQQYPQHHPQHPQHPQPQALPHGITPLPPTAAPTTRRDGPFAFTHQELDTRALAAWSPEHVAQWMLNAGIELQVCERFVENDITGSILITLKFEDLKELGIPSFGVRTNVWNQISGVKSKKAAAAAPAKEQPRSHTPIEDVPDRAVRREVRRMNSCATPTAGPSANKPVLRRGPSTRRIKNRTTDDITPLESVSIVGIEQVLPKPHQCSKGENCSKWRRQQRLLESLRREHPSAIESSSSNGIILIAGDPGNPATARAITPTADEVFRPVSDAVSDALQPAPSVVASSDVMGPGFTPVMMPPVALAPETLRAVQARDPQDNVRQFLSFQHAQAAATSEVPPTPPFELYPTVTARPSQAHERLRALPRLDTSAVRAVSRSTAAAAAQQKRHSHGNATPNSGGSLKSASAGHPQSAHPSLGSANNAHYSNYYNYPQSSKTASAAPTSGTSYTYTAIEESPGSRTPLGGGLAPAPYRFGTPFTEVDVPVTAVPTGPIARDTSQSVPPDMNYRMPAAAAAASASGPAPTLQRTMSRASARRPSFPVLPSLHENRVGHQRAASAMGHRTVAPAQYRQGGSPTNTTNTNNNTLGVRQLQAPPRHVYPWSPAQKNFEKAIAPLSLATATQSSGGSSSGSTGSSSGSTTTTTTSTPASSLSSAAAAKSTPPPNGVTFQGAVKKRRTKMLRHEWNDRFITLKGTRLAVHKDQAHVDRTLEYVDIDDYAIACSTMAASTSKLNAAFKAMNIRRGGSSSSGDVVSGISKDDVAAFAFQLIPQDSKAGLRLKKRESTMGGGEAASSSSSASLSSGGTAPGPADAVNGTGKTHHFAVKSRDNRIEWMRELMLAKAMRQKGAGFEVSVNGNMI